MIFLGPISFYDFFRQLEAAVFRGEGFKLMEMNVDRFHGDVFQGIPKKKDTPLEV